MKFRLSLVLANGRLHDVTLSCDVTATVADAARALIRAGVCSDPELEKATARRTSPVTLRAKPGLDSMPLLLDPMSPIGQSGLRSGWIVEAIPEFGSHSHGTRLAPIAGFVEVLNGAHAGVTYSLIAGSNLIGRDMSCRVYLNDVSVSRRHVAVEVGSQTVLRELGSANGMVVDGVTLTEHVIDRACTVVLGEVRLRITRGPPASAAPQLSHRAMHTRSPRVTPRFSASEREFPAAPTPVTPSRIPVLAMLAPMLMGGVMFAVTQSPMSLMMMAFSPLMMVGSWIDGALGGKRKLRRELAQFVQSMGAERAALSALREREVAVRMAETPSLIEVQSAIRKRDELLWTRRPEHRSFLEVRFGEGALPSRTELTLPARGETAHAQWAAMRELEREFSEVAPVPVIERFERCGSIGIAGEPLWAAGMARSVVLQLVGLHSPAELTLACFAGPDQTQEWAWLKWLPHVDTVTSPLPVWQLADDETRSTRLILALEGLLETRQSAGSSRGEVRSHLDRDTRNDEGQGEAVRELPTVPSVVVLVLDDGQIDASRLIALAEAGPDVGIHLLWVGRSSTLLPAACRTFVELGEAEGTVHFVRSATKVALQRLEQVEMPVAQDLARRLAPVEDTGARVLDESDLPKNVNLRELHETDLLGGARPIMQAWARTGSLVGQWRAGEEREPLPLSAVVGQGADGAAAIDLRTHGPHALVGGTTGAGKSEFLQSWIMSLAARVSPDRLTFLLVDYKGGAAFAECTDLPHTVGLVTDLSPHLVRRALTSLRAELLYREELLAHHGAKDLITMERRSDSAAPPVLVIVIDEFAALAGDVPEFVEGIIDVAQRGRSLGLHLIMATQRPAGVIKDNLRANTNLRVALRMADESDSSDVIGVKDAAFFSPEAPGRGAIKVGPGRIAHFQTGYLGGRASAPVIDTAIEVRSLSFAEGEAWDIPPDIRASRKRRVTPPRDIEQLRDGIVAAAATLRLDPPRRPWLEPLPELLELERLQSSQTAARADSAAFGLRDDPAAQAQHLLAIDFESAGNVAVIGASGTGKTSALITLAASLSQRTCTLPVQIYAIDAGGGALDAISVLPTVGAVAQLSDLELVTRVLGRLLELITVRGPKFSAVRASGLGSYRATAKGADEARVILMLDGFAAFRQSTETLGGATTPFQLLSEIMMTGRSVGVHVVLTADRATAIPGSIASSVQQQLVLRLASPHDYAHLGVNSDALEGAPPGRAVLAGETDEIQIALLGGGQSIGAASGFGEQARALEALAAELVAQGVTQVPEVRNAPEHVLLSSLPVEALGQPVFGINSQSFAPVSLPTSGLGVIAGPAQSGLSTAALCCVEALSRWAIARGEAVERILLTLEPDGLRTNNCWSRVAFGAEAVRDLARSLTAAFGGKPAVGRVGAGGALGGGLGDTDALGVRGIIVVERPAEAEGTDAMPELLALAKAARRADMLVLFECELGTGGSNWDLLSALKQPRWGLTLQPDDGETQSPFREPLGRVRRADFPPGRGFAIEAGRVTPVHVAVRN